MCGVGLLIFLFRRDERVERMGLFSFCAFCFSESRRVKEWRTADSTAHPLVRFFRADFVDNERCAHGKNLDSIVPKPPFLVWCALKTCFRQNRLDNSAKTGVLSCSYAGCVVLGSALVLFGQPKRAFRRAVWWCQQAHNQSRTGHSDQIDQIDPCCMM